MTGENDTGTDTRTNSGNGTEDPNQRPQRTGNGNSNAPDTNDGQSGDGYVDSPPYEIEEPRCDDGQRDPLWLCENMPAEPSLSFEQYATSLSVFADEGLTLDDDTMGSQYYTTILQTDSDRDRLDPEHAGNALSFAQQTDFETEAILVVQTGWGSSSVMPHLKRIEQTETGIHAFGCHRAPCGGDGDYTSRTLLARFEQPETLADGLVSLTVDPAKRVTVSVTDGVVTLKQTPGNWNNNPAAIPVDGSPDSFSWRQKPADSINSYVDRYSGASTLDL